MLTQQRDMEPLNRWISSSCHTRDRGSYRQKTKERIRSSVARLPCTKSNLSPKSVFRLDNNSLHTKSYMIVVLVAVIGTRLRCCCCFWGVHDDSSWSSARCLAAGL